MPNDYNIQKKATEKMNRYVDLHTEYPRLWNKVVKVVIVKIGVTSNGQTKLREECQQNTRTAQNPQSRDQPSLELYFILEKVLCFMLD